MRFSVLVLLVMLVTMGGCYENRRRRPTTTTTSTFIQPEFDEVNVVKFNADNWRGDDEVDEDNDDEEKEYINYDIDVDDADDDDDDDDDDDAIGIKVNSSPGVQEGSRNTNNWLTSAIEEVMGDDFGMDNNMNSLFGNDLSVDHIFGSNIPDTIFVNSNIDSASGPNMCHKRHVERHRSNTNHNSIFTSSCTFINGKFNCTQRTSQNGVTIVVHNTWTCCEGFDKDPTQKGCPIVKRDTNLECMQYANMTELIAAFTTFEFNNYLTGDDEYTIIAPSQDALQEYEKHLGQSNENVLEITPEMVAAADLIKDRLLTHILPTTISITDFKGAMKVQTALNNSHLFFYKHSYGNDLLKDLDVSVNCKILEPIYMNSKNGRVYTLEGFLNPLKKSFKQILEEHSEAKEFLEVIDGLELSEVSTAGRTVFVPTDKAFEGLSEWAREKVKKNALDVVKSLSALYPLCPHQFNKVIAIKTIDGSMINISKSGEAVKFNTAVLEGSEIISSEGTIMYFIDSFPNAEIVPPSELVRKLGASKFADLMESSNFQEDRDTRFSVVATSNEAMQNVEESEDVSTMIKFHTIVSPIESNALLHTEDADNKVYYIEYDNSVKREKLYFMQCVPVQEHRTPLGYSIFTADKILPKAERTLSEIIENDPNFSKFLQYLTVAKMHEVLAGMENQFTLLAVENKVFEELGADQLAKLNRDESYVREVLKNHIIPQVFCIGDPSKDMFANLPTVGSHRVRWMVKDGEITAAGQVVKREESNRVASNGVLHTIDGLIIKETKPYYFFVFYE